MKKVASKQSPPKLLGGCAPPRRPLVAMDAVAAAGGRERTGPLGGAAPLYPGCPPCRVMLTAPVVP